MPWIPRSNTRMAARTGIYAKSRNPGQSINPRNLKLSKKMRVFRNPGHTISSFLAPISQKPNNTDWRRNAKNCFFFVFWSGKKHFSYVAAKSQISNHFICVAK